MFRNLAFLFVASGQCCEVRGTFEGDFAHSMFKCNHILFHAFVHRTSCKCNRSSILIEFLLTYFDRQNGHKIVLGEDKARSTC